ncbi:hypothetical protein O3P69_009773 [Scylla paramamosain]|uniref:Reverse transcriptase domain-containing protein n=1 Tax=Scylla paramamosain TaxID=85552 RepID=A0AAW0SMZ5_SCYPA
METTQVWVQNQWMEDQKRNLSDEHVGSKQCWGLVKDSQGETSEPIIASFLRENSSTVSLQPASQRGFVKKKLLFLTPPGLPLHSLCEWSNDLDKGRPTADMALDIAGSFYRVWHGVLLERLLATGVDGASGLGPLLWNIYINDLLCLIPSARAYIDDITISLIGL